MIDWLRYRSNETYYGRYEGEMSLARYSYIADGKRIELRSRLDFSCPEKPRDSLTYARRDPTVTDISDAEEVALLIVGLPILVLAFLRSGFLRIREGVLAIRLLRTGRVVVASRENLALPGRPPAVVTSAEVEGSQLLVITPAPLLAGDRQTLLIDRGLRIVAWDLLPFVPLVDPGGALAIPPMSGAFPRAFAPMIALVAFAVPWIAW